MNAAPPRSRCNLLLHCGASAVSRNALSRVKTPSQTATWTPVPHLDLLQRVEQTLAANEIEIINQVHSLSHEGLRYFGLLEVAQARQNDEYAYLIGVRNSHDRTFPAGIVAGARVLVCDNLSFSGEVKLARKHTRFILRDLPALAHQAISRIVTSWNHQDHRIEMYHNTKITDKTAHDLVIRASDVGVCSNRQIPRIIGEWRDPSHEAFKPRTLWSYFNAYTEVFKEGNLAELPKRTQALHGLLDNHAGLQNPSLN
jgi:hypothetical protein